MFNDIPGGEKFQQLHEVVLYEDGVCPAGVSRTYIGLGLLPQDLMYTLPLSKHPLAWIYRSLIEKARAALHMGFMAHESPDARDAFLRAAGSEHGYVETWVHPIHHMPFFFDPTLPPSYLLRSVGDELWEIDTAEIELLFELDSVVAYSLPRKASDEAFAELCGLAQLETEKRTDDAFSEEWIRAALGVYALVVLTIADGLHVMAYATDSSEFTLSDQLVYEAGDLVVATDWYREHKHLLTWDFEWFNSLRLPGRGHY